jgi:hypothetical protein
MVGRDPANGVGWRPTAGFEGRVLDLLEKL